MLYLATNLQMMTKYRLDQNPTCVFYVYLSLSLFFPTC